jgi:hypothetical protein
MATINSKTNMLAMALIKRFTFEPNSKKEYAKSMVLHPS